MNIESLYALPNMDVVLELQRELSAARSETELMYHFALRFGRLSGAERLVDLDVAGLAAGDFRVRNRLALDRTDLTLTEVKANDRWGSPAEAIEPCSGSWLGGLIADSEPKLVRGLDRHVQADLLGHGTDQCDLLAVPIFHAGEIGQWLILIAHPGVIVSADQLRMATANLNLFARAVAQRRTHRRVNALKGRLALGLAEVARIQRALLPVIPAVEGIEIAVHYRPSAIAGGDYYDFGRFDDGRIGLVVADVAGHGPGAAVVMAMLRTIMSSYRLSQGSPTAVVPYANQLLRDGLTPGAFVTAIFVLLDPQSGEVVYFNCGHCHPCILQRDGCAIHLTGGGAPPLGILDDLDPAPGNFALQPNELLCLYTDGMVEAPAADGSDRFGLARLERALRSAGSARQRLDRLVAELDAFCGESPSRDDECVVLMRRAMCTTAE